MTERVRIYHGRLLVALTADDTLLVYAAQVTLAPRGTNVSRYDRPFVVKSVSVDVDTVPPGAGSIVDRLKMGVVRYTSLSMSDAMGRGSFQLGKLDEQGCHNAPWADVVHSAPPVRSKVEIMIDGAHPPVITTERFSVVLDPCDDFVASARGIVMVDVEMMVFGDELKTLADAVGYFGRVPVT